MKILHVVPTFYPATFWGGPIWSTKAICDGIATRPGMDVRVLTTDAASPRRGHRVAPVPLGYPVHYARRIAGNSIAPGLFARLPAMLHWADVVHLTATYSAPTLPVLLAARVMGKPVVWSPRGAMLATATWADAPRRRLKQRFTDLAQVLRPAATCLHVTSDAEAVQSAAQMPGIATRIIPNAVDVPHLPARAPRDAGVCRLIYLSRLHPLKGLDILLDAMAALPEHVTLDIYGGGDPTYVQSVQGRVAALGHRVRLHGHVDGAAKAAAFAGADLFVLPSYSENFGIAVAEAMAHGLPVLTTNRTPWADVVRHDCGTIIDPDRGHLAQAILTLSAADLRAMGARGRAWMARDFSPNAMVDAFVALYRDLAAPQATAEAALLQKGT